jgi:hypothetical protein
MELNTITVENIATLVKSFLRPIVLEVVEEALANKETSLAMHVHKIAEVMAEKEMANHNDTHDHQAMENTISELEERDEKEIDTDMTRDVLRAMLDDVEIETTLRLRR